MCGLSPETPFPACSPQETGWGQRRAAVVGVWVPPAAAPRPLRGCSSRGAAGPERAAANCALQ